LGADFGFKILKKHYLVAPLVHMSYAFRNYFTATKITSFHSLSGVSLFGQKF